MGLFSSKFYIFFLVFFQFTLTEKKEKKDFVNPWDSPKSALPPHLSHPEPNPWVNYPRRSDTPTHSLSTLTFTKDKGLTRGKVHKHVLNSYFDMTLRICVVNSGFLQNTAQQSWVLIQSKSFLFAISFACFSLKEMYYLKRKKND